jgi:hypothetical protein
MKIILSRKGLDCRWDQDENYAYLRSAYPGQEFVLDTNDYPEAVDWASELIENNAT